MPRVAKNRNSVRLTYMELLATDQDVATYVAENLEGLAGEIEAEAKATYFPTSKTGALKRSISSQKSRFEGGGYIVKATAPHAHLVEYGHLKVLPGGIVAGHVPAHPFLHNARNRVLRRAIARSKNA